MKKSSQILILLFVTITIFPCCTQKNDLIIGNWEKVTDGMNFPESPAWNGKSAMLISNCYGNWIAEIRNDIVDTFLVHTPDNPILNRTNGLVFFNGFLFACDFGNNSILKIGPDKSISVISTGTDERSLHRPNDITVGPDNCLYVTDPFHYDKSNPDGVVYKIDPVTGQSTIAISNLAFPNGIAFSPDKKWLYVCESALNRVVRFPFFNGIIYLQPEVVIELAGGDPDGIVFDKNGNLYIAHFGGGAIYIISPKGSIIQCLKAPGKKPTNMEFCGKNLKTLYLTEVETNAIYKIDASIKGFAYNQ